MTTRIAQSSSKVPSECPTLGREHIYTTLNPFGENCVGRVRNPFAAIAEYGLNAASVFAALGYYYENVEAMRVLEAEHEEQRREIRR
jgi:hypothetical protein